MIFQHTKLQGEYFWRDQYCILAEIYSSEKSSLDLTFSNYQFLQESSYRYILRSFGISL